MYSGRNHGRSTGSTTNPGATAERRTTRRSHRAHLLTSAFAALAITVVLATAAADPDVPTLTIAPQVVKPGESVTVEGSNLQACEGEVLLEWTGHPNVTVEPQKLDEGSFGELRLTIPGDVPPESWTLQATCLESVVAREVVNLVSLDVDKTSGAPGDTVWVQGRGFTSCDVVEVTWKDLNKPTLLEAARGWFRGQFAVPDDAPAGATEVTVGCSAFGTYSFTFTVVVPSRPTPTSPTPTVSTPTGTPTTATVSPVPSSPTTTTPSGSPTTSAQVPPTTSGGAPPTTSAGPSPTASVPPTTGPPPSPPPGKHVNPVLTTMSVPFPVDFRMSLVAVLAVLALAALFFLLVAFPAELFNKTYENNEVEITKAFGWMSGVESGRIRRAVSFIGFLATIALMSLLLADRERPDGNVAAEFIAFLVATLLVILIYEGSIELFRRSRTNTPGRLRALPSALFVGLACCLLSWGLHLEPAYFYGMIAGFVAAKAARPPAPDNDGPAVLTGVLVLVAVGVAAWIGRYATYDRAHGDHAEFAWVVGDAVLFWIIVLGVEGLTFGLVPLRFLDGERLRDWHRIAWLLAQSAAVLFFVYVFVVQAYGPDSPGIDVRSVLRALAFFAFFGLVSVGFWLYFRWDGRPTAHYSDHAAPSP